MKKIAISLIALILYTGTAKSTAPFIAMETTKAIGTYFSFSLQAISDGTLIKVDFGDGVLVDKTINASYTLIADTLVGSHIVRITGSGITRIDCNSKQLTSLNVSGYTGLTWIICFNNQLTNLDVTSNTTLIGLNCHDNLLDTLVVSKNTALQYLECNNNLLTGLDVSKNTTLTTLECYYNYLDTLDVSKNTALTHLECYENPLNSLDITKNIALYYLDCSDDSLKTIDISKNTALSSLTCRNNQLTNLDVSNDTMLTWLSCRINLLTSLDVSKNKALITLYCNVNQLTELDITNNKTLGYLDCGTNKISALDITNNTSLKSFFCWGNQLTFATLPLNQASWSIYSYAPQNHVPIANTLYTGVELDLSDQLTINGNTTVYTWKMFGGITLVNGTDYTLLNGKTVFLKTQTDSVYCEMTNATFPGFAFYGGIRTTNAKVVMNTGIGTKKNVTPEIRSCHKTLFINSLTNANLSIYDVSGRLIISNSVHEGTQKFQLTETGIYLVKVTWEKGSITKKVYIE